MNLPDVNQPRGLTPPESLQLLNHADSEDLNKTLEQHLSPRQVEILVLMMQGYSRSKISARLNLSVRTVDTVRARILIKLNAKTNADLVLKVLDLLM